jgi:hypothetical protein
MEMHWCLGSIKALVLFSFVWCVWVIVGPMMMVWLGSCQARCARWRFCGAIVEGFAAKKISSARTTTVH